MSRHPCQHTNARRERPEAQHQHKQIPINHPNKNKKRNHHRLQQPPATQLRSQQRHRTKKPATPIFPLRQSDRGSER